MKKLVLALAIGLAALNVAYFMMVPDAADVAEDAELHDVHGDHPPTPGLAEVFTANNPADAAEQPSGWRMWGAIGNFTLLLLLLVAFGRAPMRAFLTQRKQTIAQGLVEARKMKEEAQAKYDEYSARLNRLNEELASIRAEMVKAGEAERDRIVREAEAKAARMRRDAEFLIEQQMKQLRKDLTSEAVSAAISAAEAVLRDQTTGQDQERIAQAYLERLARSGSEGRA